MWALASTLGIILWLAYNHLQHGWGCWGLQPGGPCSARLYALQLLIGLIATIFAGISLFKVRPRIWGAHIAIIVTCCAGVMMLFITEGWTAFTSLHFQGPENLPPFLSASFTTILSSVYIVLCKRLSRSKNFD